MTQLILYTHEASPPASSIVILAELLGLKLDKRTVQLINLEHKAEDFKKMNPMGTIPVLQDGDFTVSESHAILKYLLEKYGSADVRESLYPRDLETRAIIDQCMFFNAGVFFVRLKVVALPIILFGSTGPAERQLEDIETAYGVVEAYLTSHRYVAADHLTLADLSLGTTATAMHYLHALDSTKFPRCAAWIARLNEESWFKDINANCNSVFSHVMKTLTEKNKKEQK